MRHALRILVLVLAAAAALAPTADASPPKQRIVFASLRDGNTDLWVVNADGSGAMRLTTDPRQDLQPTVSPNGKTIAFVRGVNFGSVPVGGDIWVMNVDGSDAHELIADPATSEYRPDFSPDGKRLLFTRSADPLGLMQEIWVARADGTNAHRVVENATYAAWSNDGRRIVFGNDPAGAIQVAIADADGRNVRVLTKDGGTAPQWSPDGARIVFTTFRRDKGEIWMIDPDGSHEHLVAASDGKDGFATWSPDSRRIAWASTRHTPCPKDGSDLCPQRIFTAAITGVDVRAVSSGVTDSSPAYFPRPY